MAAVAVLAGAGYLVAHRSTNTGRRPLRGSPATNQVIYTARTANDATITLPGVVASELRRIGLNHQSIALTRVDPAGNVSTSSIDMTPRTGDTVLKVGGRINTAIDKKISNIETAVNSPARSGGQALYAGLTKTDFTSAPVMIISTGIDLANPDNFRSLQWSVPAEEVVAAVKKAGALPALHGPVTFVLAPTAGPQPQLEQAQKNYIKTFWKTLLTASGATSVTFIDATGTSANPGGPSAPPVPVPHLPPTPIRPVPRGEHSVTCTVPGSYFVYNTAELVDPAQTAQNLTPCITAALAAHATFALDGWASYEGPLNANGKPEFNYPGNQTLSQERVQTIASLLFNDLRVPPSAITRQTGHGNLNQPNPDPRSPENRVVRITYTTK